MDRDERLTELEAELARQDEELTCAMAVLEGAAAMDVRFDVPASFFHDIEELCRPRSAAPVFGLRG